MAADTLFEQKRLDTLNSGVLLRDFDHIIQGQRDGTEDGLLRLRLLALIFLISRVARIKVGVNATVDVLLIFE